MHSASNGMRQFSVHFICVFVSNSHRRSIFQSVFEECGRHTPFDQLLHPIPLCRHMHRHRPRDLRTGYDIHKMSACPFSPSISRNAFPPRIIPSRRQIHVPAGPVHTIWRSPLHHPRVVFVSVLLLQTMLIFVAGSALNKQVHET